MVNVRHGLRCPQHARCPQAFGRFNDARERRRLRALLGFQRFADHCRGTQLLRGRGEDSLHPFLVSATYVHLVSTELILRDLLNLCKAQDSLHTGQHRWPAAENLQPAT